MKKYVYGMLVVIAFLIVVMVVRGGTGTEVSQVSLESFEQACNDNGDEWVKMRPMKDGEFVSDAKCFGCLGDERNHICNYYSYLSFESSSNRETEIIQSSVSLISDETYSGLNKLEVSILSMSCSSCSLGIKSILEKLDGVVEVKINFNEKTGEIIYDSDIITQEEIMNSDAFLSYPGKVVSDVKLE